MMIDDIFQVLYVNARSKSAFVFSDFKMAEYKRCLKMVGKVFLIIKNGPGFMVSQMHSLFIVVVEKGTQELTSEIATKSFMKTY